MEKKECISIKMLAVSGKDFIEMGIEPGKKIGELLSSCLALVLENPERIPESTCFPTSQRTEFCSLLSLGFCAYNERKIW